MDIQMEDYAQPRVPEHDALQAALRVALADGSLQLFYQPVISLQTGAVVALEALLRWTDPVFGSISPARFIAVAEASSDLVDKIGEWVIQRACRDMRERLDLGMAPLRVALNVSPRQFLNPLLADQIEQALIASRLDPQCLCLEITEGAVMQDSAIRTNFLRMKAMGIHLLLDDFGTGFSSLSYLKRFSFDRVKIDRSFIANLGSDSDDAAIVKAIISMAHSLGTRVIAEGVETEEQCIFLRDHQCDEMQGFLVAPGLSTPELMSMLRDGRGLPAHLLKPERNPRTLLLVDDEPNIVASLRRLLRRDNYEILTANSAQDALEILTQRAVDVIVSDQRMPGMTGVEFLRKAKEMYPETIRIVLSGFTELQSVTDAVNEGAIYKFLTKPWDDAQLRAHVEEAFNRKDLADDNRRLNEKVRDANLELAVANRQLEDLLDQKRQQLLRERTSLEIVREALQHIQLAVIGVDDQGTVVFANVAAQSVFDVPGALLGSLLEELLPGLPEVDNIEAIVTLPRGRFRAMSNTMGRDSLSRGKLVTLTPFGIHK